MAQHYFVKNSLFPLRGGAIVIRLNGRHLETVAGDFNPSGFGCSVDSRGRLHVKKGYSSEKIEVDEAKKYEGCEPYMLLTQAIAGRVGGMVRPKISLL